MHRLNYYQQLRRAKFAEWSDVNLKDMIVTPNGNWVDKIQDGLNLTGAAEPTPFSDAANGLISLGRIPFNPGHRMSYLADAGANFAGMLPYWGDAAKVTRRAHKAHEVGKKLGPNIVDSAKEYGTSVLESKKQLGRGITYGTNAAQWGLSGSRPGALSEDPRPYMQQVPLGVTRDTAPAHTHQREPVTPSYSYGSGMNAVPSSPTRPYTPTTPPQSSYQYGGGGNTVPQPPARPVARPVTQPATPRGYVPPPPVNRFGHVIDPSLSAPPPRRFATESTRPPAAAPPPARPSHIPTPPGQF